MTLKTEFAYCSKNGTNFNIHIEKGSVPEKADYWGYYFHVNAKESDLNHIFKAIVSKTLCSSSETADQFVVTEPVEYLKSILLEKFKDGRSPIYWPDISDGWVVL